MIVDIVLYGAIAYVAGWAAWRFVFSGTAKKSKAKGSWVAQMFGRLFGCGWVFPGSAIALAAILFFFGADLGLVSRWSEPERAELDHFVEALSFYDDASSLYSNSTKLTNQDWESVNAMLRAALAEGEQVSPELLLRLHPELPQRFQEQFLAGLQTGSYGLKYYTAAPQKGKGKDSVEHHGSDSLDAGRLLLGDWNAWFNINGAQILEKVD
jgi:hypothetical protein